MARDIMSILGVEEDYQVPDALLTTMLDSKKAVNLMSQVESYEETYEYFSNSQADRNKFMQDFTPKCIRNIVAGIIGKCATVSDICAGIGGLSVSINADRYHCEELSESAIPFLLLNMALKNAECEVENKNVLTGQVKEIYILSKGDKFSRVSVVGKGPRNEKYDAVVANPPYSLKFDDIDNYINDKRFGYGLTPKGKSDYLFVEQCLWELKDDGIACVILPHGILFRGAKEGAIRRELIMHNCIEGIIGLPENLFINTSIPTVIMILKKCRQEKGIFFIDASREFKKIKSQNTMMPEQINNIINTYRNRREINKYSRFVSNHEIEENDFNLNINRYIDTFEPEILPPLSNTINELTAINDEIAKTERALVNMCRELVTSDPEDQKGIQKAIRLWDHQTKEQYVQMKLGESL